MLIPRVEGIVRQMEIKMLKDLERQESDLREKLADVLGLINQEKLRIAEEIHGVRIGGVVTSKGKDFLVTSIDTKWDKPWVSGNPRKADGSFGAAVRNLYGYWEARPNAK